MPDDPRPPVPGLRRDFTGTPLLEQDLAPTWLEQLDRWFAEAAAEGGLEPNAMVLATASAAAMPSVRTVLLKAYDERGLVFFTNLLSRKGREMTENPNAAIVIPWLALSRQVVVTGWVERVAHEDTTAYFRSRPRAAQVSAWASQQSEVVGSREELEQQHAELSARFEGDEVPLPPFWGGFRLVPRSVEFWQGRPSRLHDRLRFRRDGERWLVERLAP